jgi:hypothetical protein
MKMFSGEGDVLKYSNNSIVQMTIEKEKGSSLPLTLAQIY